MRLRTRFLAIATFAIVLTAISGTPALAQAPVPLEGSVDHAADKTPVEGAVVDIYRTDVKSKYQTKTDRKGNFTYPVAPQGVYTIVVSAPGLNPQYRADVRLSISAPRLDFHLEKGDGSRPTLEQVQAAIKGGPADDPAALEARRKAEAEYAKAKVEKEQFDGRKARFDAGALAMQNKDYPTAITELSAAIEGLDDADPAYYGELIGVAGANLAETHYRVGVELFNESLKGKDPAKKEAAKVHLEKGARAIAMSIKFLPTGQTAYAIQGKTLSLLVDKFSASDQAETAATAFLKASEMEIADPKKKVEFIVMAGDAYRYGYMTDQAVATYKLALAADANNISAYYGIGLACMGTPEANDKKRLEIWQTAADYLKVFAEKAAGDPRASEVKGLLDMLAKDFKIKPRPIK